jgi:hypothetical protein
MDAHTNNNKEDTGSKQYWCRGGWNWGNDKELSVNEATAME